MGDNRNDIVILKSSANDVRLPTYHLAHVVDDHLMRVTLVIRGDEWISSVPVHTQLFTALDLEPIDYAHIAPLMKLDGSSPRQPSKRKDPEASVDFYLAHGYPQAGVLHYLRSLANGRLAGLPTAVALAEPIRIEECNVAGPLVDLMKLNLICKDVIGEMSAPEIFDHLHEWAAEHDADVVSMLQDKERAIAALEVERVDTERIRKDLGAWSDFKNAYSFFFPDYFEPGRRPGRRPLPGVGPRGGALGCRAVLGRLPDPRRRRGVVRPGSRDRAGSRDGVVGQGVQGRSRPLHRLHPRGRQHPAGPHHRVEPEPRPVPGRAGAGTRRGCPPSPRRAVSISAAYAA